MSESAGAVASEQHTEVGRRSRRRRSINWTRGASLPVILALAVSSLVVAAAPQLVVAAGPYIVTNTADTSDTNPGDGVCVAVGGGCTLRAAIEEANTTTDVDTIAFGIPGGGPGTIHTITPATALPAVTEPVIIDGYTQIGAQPNTLAVGNNAELRIVLSGASVGGGFGLDLSGSTNSSVIGLVVNGFSDGGSAGAGIVAGPGANIIGNFIGTNAAGTGPQPNFHGVLVPGVDGVIVGGTGPADRNLISGNTNFGVYLTDDADANQIVGNYIGTDRDGTAALGNNYGVVMSATGGARLNDNFIGGDVPGAGNVVSGNVVGVRVDFADDTRVLGNLIGTDVTGSAPIPNGVGIDVGTSGSSPETRTFRTIIGNGTTGGRNVISGNDSEGISLWNSTDDNVIRGNYIGVGANGFEPLGNNGASTNPDIGGYGGIVLRNSSSRNEIGGPNPGDGNLVVNNNNGIVVFSGLSNRVRGNSTYDNEGRGVWFFGNELNDPGDLDEPFNNRGQNFPVLRQASIDDSDNLLVETSIDSLVTASDYPITVDYYVADTAASGEGLELIGTSSISEPGTSQANLGLSPVTSGFPIVATATDAAGNTSNFSNITFIDQPERLAPSNEGDRFGQALDVDGNRMVVSSPGADVGEEDAGIVQVFERTDADSPWLLTATIPSPDPEGGGGFGDAVALSGGNLAIGESDRYGSSDERGRVWVFSLTGSSWTLVAPGGAPEIEGTEIGDEFGASLAWLDETTLAVGAPGAAADAGRVALVSDAGTGWNITDVSLPIGVAPVAGDQFGFDIATGGGPEYGQALVVGAPGRDDGGQVDSGSIYFFSVAEGSATWTNSTGYSAGSRVGTSVDTFGDRAVAAGYGGGAITVGILEYVPNPDFATEPTRPFVWNGDAGVSAGLGFSPGDGPVNDYVAIDGTTIAIGRPGDGGSVAVFERDATGWPAAPASVIEPDDRRPGDRIGRALALDGPTLAVGAPGDGGVQGEFLESGAVRTYSVATTATTATFVETSDFAPWEDPTNWDIGVVPGPGDTVIVPFGTYPEINDATSVTSLQVAGNVRVRAPFVVTDELTIGAFAVIDIQGDPGDSLTLPPTVTLDGQINNGGPVIATGPTDITGIGTFVNDDELRKTGPGTLTIGLDIGWTSRFYSEVNVQQGSIEIRGPLVESSGTFRVAAGTTLSFEGDLAVGPGSRFVTQITGSSISLANFGQVKVGGFVGFNSSAPFPGSGTVGLTAMIDGYAVAPSDVYPIITCGSECAYGPPGAANIQFDDVDLNGLDVVLDRPSVNLQLIENKIPNPGDAVGQFGFSVDIDGDWAVVGAPSGGIAVFERVLGAWEFRESLGGNPGTSVAIGGNYLAADGILWSRADPSEEFVGVWRSARHRPRGHVGRHRRQLPDRRPAIDCRHGDGVHARRFAVRGRPSSASGPGAGPRGCDRRPRRWQRCSSRCRPVDQRRRGVHLRDRRRLHFARRNAWRRVVQPGRRSSVRCQLGIER